VEHFISDIEKTKSFQSHFLELKDLPTNRVLDFLESRYLEGDKKYVLSVVNWLVANGEATAQMKNDVASREIPRTESSIPPTRPEDATYWGPQSRFIPR
jgi:hypothetical protein